MSLVAQQYENFVYPTPIDDIEKHLTLQFYEPGDPAFFSAQLWPEGRPRDDLRILSVGCGPNQAAVLAFNNPRCTVLGIDFSENSLANQHRLKIKHHLSNLEILKLDLLDIASLGRDFDVIVCTGVLHHLKDPNEGLRALANVLSPDGSMLIMVYGTVARTGIYLLQDAFRRLGIAQTRQGIDLVKEFLQSLPKHHAARFLTETHNDTTFDAGLVDLLLHPQDRSYTVPEVIHFVENNGLYFQGWADNRFYYPDGLTNLTPVARAAIEALDTRSQWQVCEDVGQEVSKQIFFVRNKPVAPITFSGSEWLDYIPTKHPMIRVIERGAREPLRNAKAFRSVPFEIDPFGSLLYDQADGFKTIRETIADIKDRELAETYALKFYSRLWHSGHIFLSHKPNKL